MFYIPINPNQDVKNTLYLKRSLMHVFIRYNLCPFLNKVLYLHFTKGIYLSKRIITLIFEFFAKLQMWNVCFCHQ